MSGDMWQPIARVSTNDKGQRPERQEEVMEAWASREVQALLPCIRDVGTSATFTDPFDREKFVAAIVAAKASGAVGILAEKVDRVCGQGSDELGHVRYVLRKKHGLRLVFADRPLSMQGHDNFAGNLTGTVDAEVRRERIATDRTRIKGGIATRRKKGLPVGGATQAKDSPELRELVYAVAAAADDSWGWRRIAREVSTRRGAFAASLTPKEQRKRKVSYATVRRILLHGPKSYMEMKAQAQSEGSAETSPNNGGADS